MPDLIQPLTLTGPPSLGGVIMPHPTKTSKLDPQWVGQHRTKTMLSGEVKVVQRRYRGRFRLGWKGLSATAFSALLDVLEESSFYFTPRTVALGEASTAVDTDGSITTLLQTYLVRTVSPIPTTKPVMHETYDIDVELETINVVGDTLGVSITVPGVGVPGGDGGGDGEDRPPINPDTVTESNPGGIVVDCPAYILFVTNDPSAFGIGLTDDSDVDLDTILGPGDVSKFTKTLIEHRGYTFDVQSIRFYEGGSPSNEAEPVEAFNWTVCPLACVLEDPSSPSANFESAQRDIYFEIMTGEIASGTYTVEITVIYDCDEFDSTITFNITKS